MPTFMESLAENPKGGSSIFDSGAGSQQPDYGGALGIVNQLKDREMRDFQNKAQFMSDLSLKQDRLRSLFDPNQQQQQQQAPMGVQVAHDPSAMTGYQKGELGIRQQELGIKQGELGVRQQQVAQIGKMGEERLKIQSDQEKLRHEDLQRKIEDSTKKFELMQAELERKTKSGEDTLQAHKDLAVAVEERHKLELANQKYEFDVSTKRKQDEFDINSKQHQKTIDNLEKERERTKETTTEVNPERTKSVSTTKKVSATGTVNVVGKDGKTYPIPADKLDDWNANHAGGR